MKINKFFCKHCHIEFTAKRKDQVYCSNLCYKKSYLRIYKLKGYEWKQKWNNYHLTRDKNIYDELITFMYGERYISNKIK